MSQSQVLLLDELPQSFKRLVNQHIQKFIDQPTCTFHNRRIDDELPQSYNRLVDQHIQNFIDQPTCTFQNRRIDDELPQSCNRLVDQHIQKFIDQPTSTFHNQRANGMTNLKFYLRQPLATINMGYIDVVRSV